MTDPAMGGGDRRAPDRPQSGLSILLIGALILGVQYLVMQIIKSILG